jgi:hypothetical protein
MRGESGAASLKTPSFGSNEGSRYCVRNDFLPDFWREHSVEA